MGCLHLTHAERFSPRRPPLTVNCTLNFRELFTPALSGSFRRINHISRRYKSCYKVTTFFMGISFYVYGWCPGVLDFACKGFAVRHFVCRDNDDGFYMFAISYILFLFIILHIYMQIHVNKLHPDMVRTCAYVANCQTPKDHRCGIRLYLAGWHLELHVFLVRTKTEWKRRLLCLWSVSIIHHV